MVRTTVVQQPVHLGIDVGTSSLKLLAVSADGTVRGRAESGYAMSRPALGAAEQDPGDWWRALIEACGRLAPAVRSTVTSIGLVGQIPTLVAVDAALRPVRPALTWQDSRAVVQAAALERHLGDPRALFGTQLPWSAGNLPAKLLWLKENEPEVVERTRWVLEPKDYIAARLTDVVAVDAWSSKGVCAIDGTPAAAVLAACGWAESVCPPAREPWEILGPLTSPAAEATGLREGVVVAVGWSDALGGILATGAMEESAAFVLSGTSDIVGVSAPAARPDDRLYLADRSIAPLALSFGPTQSSGASVLWVCELLGIGVGDAIELAADAAPAPVFVPYLSGERTPVWRTDVSGLLLGMRAGHGRAELIASVLAGVAYSARHVLEAALSTIDSDISDVHIAGRGSAHPTWVNLRRRSLGRRLLIHEEESLSALGAAMLGALAAGSSFAELSRLRRPPLVVEPEVDDIERGDMEFDRYLRASTVSLNWRNG